jgi:hypothetical protein
LRLLPFADCLARPRRREGAGIGGRDEDRNVRDAGICAAPLVRLSLSVASASIAWPRPDEASLTAASS